MSSSSSMGVCKVCNDNRQTAARATVASDAPPGQQTLPGEVGAAGVVQAVQCSQRGRLARHIEGLRSGDLHAIGQFKTLDARRQLGIAGALLMVLAVESLHQVDLPPLLAV